MWSVDQYLLHGLKPRINAQRARDTWGEAGSQVSVCRRAACNNVGSGGALEGCVCNGAGVRWEMSPGKYLWILVISTIACGPF